MSKAPSYAVFIGRFQPFHNAHHSIIKHALAKYDRLLVCVGSSKQARSPKNPFTSEERIKLIQASLAPSERDRVEFLPIRDYLYNDNLWITDIQRRVKTMIEHEPGQVTICGRLKDRSSYYLRLFPQWQCDEYGMQHPFDATIVRRAVVDGRLDEVREVIPSVVFDHLVEWQKTDTFKWVQEEQRFYDEYLAQFKSPFPLTFNTADAVVIQAGHVLVVKRKRPPGRDLLALPGGFVNPDENLEATAIRELKEETGIDVPKAILHASIIDRKNFDHPNRSLRGRVITQAHCIKLDPKRNDDYDLPSVKGSDDAAKAFWMPLVDLPEFEDQFFEDHIHIIRYFANRF